jgi:2-phosphosulfolactate phosphatase
MIDVALTPADARPADVAVVIDVLRATSTVTQALASGYGSVICADSVERARGLRGPGRVLAGEQRCRMPPGFDRGNSPLEATRVGGPELVLATTNGAPAIVAAAGNAAAVALACLLNLDAVIAGLWGCDVQIVCSGTGGAVALEDVYVAGRISAGLAGSRTDSALLAEAVARAYPTAYEALAASSNAQALVSVGLAGDIEYCSRESVLELVPCVVATGPGFAVVAADLAPATAPDQASRPPTAPTAPVASAQ